MSRIAHAVVTRMLDQSTAILAKRRRRPFQVTRPFPPVPIGGDPWTSAEWRSVWGWVREQRRAGYLRGARLRAVKAALRQLVIIDIELTAIPESGDIPVPLRIQKRVARLLKQK